MPVYKKITYAQAINQGIHQAMKLSKNVMIMGQLIDYKPEFPIEKGYRKYIEWYKNMSLNNE